MKIESILNTLSIYLNNFTAVPHLTFKCPFPPKSLYINVFQLFVFIFFCSILQKLCLSQVKKIYKATFVMVHSHLLL